MRAEEQRRQAALADQARARAQRPSSLRRPATGVVRHRRSLFPSTTPTLPAARYGHVVGIALQYLGIPYVWGGSSPSTGFDCSGSRATSTRRLAFPPAPRGVAVQHGTPVAYEQLAPGDLVFFSGLGHVGLYIGGGQFVHAPHTGDVVRISSLSERSGSYVGARRL